MFHLNVRVAWHDNRWNGAVCSNPLANSHCLDLKRIRQEKDEAGEAEMAGQWFADIDPKHLPPCQAESAAFMNEREWGRIAEHPYADSKKTTMTHGHLLPTRIPVKPYSTFAVPFYWMLRENQEKLDEMLPVPLPPDEDPPFSSPWVFSSARQRAISDLFFGRLQPGKSLVFLYTKSGHPLDGEFPRLLVGVGQITGLSKITEYDTQKTGETYPLWDRLFEHSIRPDKSAGFILPYHDYLESTGDPDEDKRRVGLLTEIAVAPERKDVMAFSYAGELSEPEVALSALVKCLDAVRIIRRHGIAEGPWETREDWLNEQIAATWEDRGAFPGAGAALEAMGMRLGTSLVLELLANGRVKTTDDPWPLLDAILRGQESPPQKAYQADINAVANTWQKLDSERRALLRLLSRFSLSPVQAKRWFYPKKRASATRGQITDAGIIENPYRISELDLGDFNENPIAMTTLDRGLLPDATVAAAHPVELPSRIESALDWRRVRAGLVSILRNKADEGDTLLTETQALDGLEALNLSRPCAVPPDWVAANTENLTGEIERIKLAADPETGDTQGCLQLSEFLTGEQRLSKIIRARCWATLSSLKEDWHRLLVETVAEGGTEIDESDPRHKAALAEQATALEHITTRKFTALVGAAGTGKTTVLGALLKSNTLQKGGILFLAPTGKARVRLSQKAGAEAMTVAQFLNAMGRYDSARQRTLMHGKQEPRRKEKTVVIDESSMLTMNDLLATISALDLAHVQRIILVGDPNQLPPIGAGRPFADFVAYLDECKDRNDDAGAALARLSVELRTFAGGPSDTLKLASWFTNAPQPPDADKVLGGIYANDSLNDLQVAFWTTPGELLDKLSEKFKEVLGLQSRTDVEGFNSALGLTPEGWVPWADHDGCENFQLLSPVRANPHGVNELNRWIQQQFRSKQLASARAQRSVALGDEEIVWGDKVILTRNGKRDGWDGAKKEKVIDYLANGEIGIACPAKGGARLKALNVAFAQRADVRFGIWKNKFSSNAPVLELAYALTVHKAQGSEFDTVFVVLPKQSRVLSRELLYTALTRSRRNMVLLIEGSDASSLFEFAKAEYSATARRNTNLFTSGIRSDDDAFPYAAHLVHRTTRGELVQSKSELVIANYLYQQGLPYVYNRPFQLDDAGRRLFPDFTFITDAGELVLWEHLGMLNREDYRRGWEWKKARYAENGFAEGKNLFITTEGPGLDMAHVASTTDEVVKALA